MMRSEEYSKAIDSIEEKFGRFRFKYRQDDTLIGKIDIGSCHSYDQVFTELIAF